VEELTTELFKEALGHFATGVTVITAASPEGPVGFTCQTFCALSLEPQLVSFNATTNSSSWPKVREAKNLAVNILSHEQEALARSFARSGVDKFEGVPHHLGMNGAPLLDGVLATVEGEILSVTTHGDHDICVVKVTNLTVQGGQPLIYFRGGFELLD
jgi:3-hydroxy-9,10-secoandrosta-1,3,5(10)-triene-9,17-dione monooxygenase reductase component